jgi:hypothetical protein
MNVLLGENYHWEIRKLIGAGDKLLPDSIIDAELNVGAAKLILGTRLELVSPEVMEKSTDKIQKAAKHYLAAVICVALKSRTAEAPYNTSKYRKNWDDKRRSLLSKADLIMERLKAK